MNNRPRFRKSAIALAVAASAGTSYLLAAPGDPLADAFQVNVSLPFQQAQPAVAMDSDGDFVVVWASYDQDGSDYAIVAKRYDAAAVSQGSESQVNTFTTFAQEAPDVAMDAAGNFVVVWSSEFQDGNGLGVYGQRFDAGGVAQGSEFQVNTTTTGEQSEPAVAMDADGDFVVVWQSDDIFAQRFDAAGAPVGGEFQVNTSVSGSQAEPAVAMDSDGDFIVVWNDTYALDGDGEGIFAQRFAADGSPVGSEFQVNTTITADQDTPAVAMDSAGNFVVAWEGDVGDTEQIFAQRHAADGTPQGDEFRVNTVSDDGDIDQEQEDPRVAMAADGNFVITWIHANNSDQRSAAFAKYYGADGTVLREDFSLGISPSNQTEVGVAADDAGNFVAGWTEFAPAIPWQTEVFARRFVGGSLSDSVEKRTPESICGKVFYQASFKSHSPKTKALVNYILEGCDAGAAASIGPELDEKLVKILGKANDAIAKLGGPAECDPQLQLKLPVDAPDVLEGFESGEDFLNSDLVTRFCDGVLTGELAESRLGEVERTPAQSCSIIHAVYLQKQGATRDKAFAKYCAKFQPGDAAASAATRDKLATGLAKKLSGLGRTSNGKLDKIGGTAVCDPDTAATFPKPTSQDPAFEAAILEERSSDCNDRQ